MIVEIQIYADTDVDAVFAGNPPAKVPGPVAMELVKAVINQGEQSGLFIRAESVRVYHYPAADNHSQWTKHYRAVWYPNPRTGCYFIGGPQDGAMIQVGFDDPPTQVKFPALNAIIYDTSPATPAADLPYSYELAGKDPERDCWVYTYSS